MLFRLIRGPKAPRNLLKSPLSSKWSRCTTLWRPLWSTTEWQFPTLRYILMRCCTSGIPDLIVDQHSHRPVIYLFLRFRGQPTVLVQIDRVRRLHPKGFWKEKKPISNTSTCNCSQSEWRSAIVQLWCQVLEAITMGTSSRSEFFSSKPGCLMELLTRPLPIASLGRFGSNGP